MEAVTQFFDSMGLDFWSLVITASLLLAGSIILGAISRFVFGKKSLLAGSVSSAIGILFVYALNIVVYCAGSAYHHFLAPLPFVFIQDGYLSLFDFLSADYTLICGQLLSMIILAFLVNLLDQWLPTGKNVFTWTIFRILTVVLAQAAHLLVTGLIQYFLPEGLITYAPVVLLIILALMLLTGALKIIVGVLISTVNPLIGALYTFFFANLIGKQITKAVLTTGILALLTMALRYFGITGISIALSVLSAYIPLLILLLLLWALILKIF